MEFTVQQVADLLGGSIEGDGNAKLRGIGRIEDAQAGELAFLSNPAKYASYAYDSQATALLVPYEWSPERPLKPAAIQVKDVTQAFGALMRMVAEALPKPPPGIHDQAYVHPEAQVDETAHVGPFAYVGRGAQVGAGTILEPHSFVGEGVRLGERCLLQSGARLLHGCVVGNRVRLLANAVVGADGFGHTQEDDGAWIRIPHLGNVVLEDDVEIGACATVDRATTGSTILRKGVKLDNLVMVAHNVTIDEHTAAAAQVGIAGSARVGKRIQLGGQVGMAGHITIADDVNIGAQSGIKNDINEVGATYFGSPAKPIRAWMRDAKGVEQIAEMRRELKALRREIEALKKP